MSTISAGALESFSIGEHPCFSGSAHFRFGRIHLAVAPECNLQCAYCSRDFDCPNESRPGVTSKIISPYESIGCVDQALKQDDRLRVIGIAGPGEPLYNEETFETMRYLHRRFPQLALCVSTNGLLLPERLDDLLACGLRTLTITINTLQPETAQKIYRSVIYNGKAYELEEGCRLLLRQQRLGLHRAVQNGLTVKINTVLIPGINQTEVTEIAEMCAGEGAYLMNLMPLIPQAEFGNIPCPSPALLHTCREKAGSYLSQFTHCKQCRADAVGVPGESSSGNSLHTAKTDR